MFYIRDRDELEKLLEGDDELKSLKEILEDISTCDDLYENYTKSELENVAVAKEYAEDMAKAMAKDMTEDMA